MDVGALPWDAIAKLIGGLLLAVGVWKTAQYSGVEKQRRKQAEESLDDAKTVEDIRSKPLPTRLDRIRKLLNNR